MKNSIPKIIHAIWVGPNDMPSGFEKVLASWHEFLPDYELRIHRDSDLEKYYDECNYIRDAVKLNKYAFISDYCRLRVLQDHGGIYLDTDMLLLRPIDDLLSLELIIGFEDWKQISAGIIGSRPNNYYINQVVSEYQSRRRWRLETIPQVLTKVFNRLPDRDKFYVQPTGMFYPFSYKSHLEGESVDKYINNNNYSRAVHLWNKNW